MNLFSISQLSRFSGIKPHTIRIWEKRYNALKPIRSEGNTRYYDGEQLRRLLNIVTLSKSDKKVSELSRLTDQKLNKLITNLYAGKDQPGMEETFISQLVSAGLNYDEEGFEKVFAHCILKYGMKAAYQKVLYPLLDRVGLMWSDRSIPPAQEHFLSNLIRQKILTAIDYLPSPGTDLAPWILFLPEAEFHEIGLLMAHYFIRSSGCASVYLGANVPLASVRHTIRARKPANLLLFMVHNDDPEKTEAYLKELKRIFNKKIFIAGNRDLLSEIRMVQPFNWLGSVEALENVLHPRLSN